MAIGQTIGTKVSARPLAVVAFAACVQLRQKFPERGFVRGHLDGLPGVIQRRHPVAQAQIGLGAPIVPRRLAVLHGPQQRNRVRIPAAQYRTGSVFQLRVVLRVAAGLIIPLLTAAEEIAEVKAAEIKPSAIIARLALAAVAAISSAGLAVAAIAARTITAAGGTIPSAGTVPAGRAVAAALIAALVLDKDGVSLVDLLHLGLRLGGTAVQIGVIFLGKPPVGRLDLVVGGARLQLQYLIGVSHAPPSCLPCRFTAGLSFSRFCCLSWYRPQQPP